MTSSARARIDGRAVHDAAMLSPMATGVVDRAVADAEDAMMLLIVSAVAAKDLAALPGRDRRALFNKGQAFAADPFATHPAARPMRGRAIG